MWSPEDVGSQISTELKPSALSNVRGAGEWKCREERAKEEREWETRGREGKVGREVRKEWGKGERKRVYRIT